MKIKTKLITGTSNNSDDQKFQEELNNFLNSITDAYFIDIKFTVANYVNKALVIYKVKDI